MAIVVTGDIPGGNPQMDEGMLQQLGLSTSPPPGALARMSGPVEGGWRVMSVWQSQEAWDAFRRDRLEPMLQQMGQPAPAFQIWELHSFMAQPGAQQSS